MEAFIKDYVLLIPILDDLRGVVKCPTWTQPTLPASKQDINPHHFLEFQLNGLSHLKHLNGWLPYFYPSGIISGSLGVLWVYLAAGSGVQAWLKVRACCNLESHFCWVDASLSCGPGDTAKPGKSKASSFPR